MSETPTIALELVLAAVIDNAGGMLAVPVELIGQNRAGMVIAITYDTEKSVMYFTLEESENVDYDE